MTTVILAVAAAAGLACPAHMWWRMRRGKRAACCPATAGEDGAAVRLQRRQQALRQRLAGLDEEGAGRTQ